MSGIERYFDDTTSVPYFVSLSAVLGNGTKIPCTFDGDGTINNLPATALWGGVVNKAAYATQKANLVESFLLQVSHHAQSDIHVMQAVHQPPKYVRKNEVASYQFPPILIDHHFRSTEDQQVFGVGSTAVWTVPSGKSGRTANRADVWSRDKEDILKMASVHVVTFDDGKNFSLHQQVRWAGKVSRRRPDSPKYQLLSSRKDVVDLYYQEQNKPIRELFNFFKFEPLPGFPNFEVCLKSLADESLRDLISRATSVEGAAVAGAPEAASEVPELRDGQGVVKFATLDVGRGIHGILVDHNGHSYQFDQHAVQGAEGTLGALLPAGTVVDLVGEQVTQVKGQQPFRPTKLSKIKVAQSVTIELQRAAA